MGLLTYYSNACSILAVIVAVAIPGLFCNAQPATCLPPPKDLVAWWRGEGTANDAIGTNHATVKGGAFLTNSQVGAGFLFNGATGYLEAPDSDLWAFGLGDFSIEFWVNFNSIAPSADLGHPSVILIAQDEGANDVRKWFFAFGGGKLSFLINDPAIGPKFLVQSPFSPVLNRWYHLAVVRGGNVFTLFQDGVAIASEAATVFIPNANAPLTIGQGEGLGFLSGLMDEIAIYRRALLPSEVLGIYSAGSLGKCATSVLPSILSAPENITLLSGASGSFSVVAAGSTPLAFQWRHAGTNIPGATSASLMLTNLGLADAGAYSVTVSNSAGAVTSTNAVLTILSAGECLPAPTQMVAWWRAEAEAKDARGTNHGVLRGGTGFGAGKVNAGFSFDGVTSYVDMARPGFEIR